MEKQSPIAMLYFHLHNQQRPINHMHYNKYINLQKQNKHEKLIHTLHTVLLLLSLVSIIMLVALLTGTLSDNISLGLLLLLLEIVLPIATIILIIVDVRSYKNLSAKTKLFVKTALGISVIASIPLLWFLIKSFSPGVPA